MSLESTMICIDTSDYMRNEDFVPTRLHAQQDAVYLVCRSKVRAHPQNDVGLLTMAEVRVLVTLTTDVEKVLVSLNKIVPNGNVDFLTSIKVAQLALRHRQEKRHKMRIVAFLGSPVSLVDEELINLAKKLRKEKVNVDIVSFGTEAEETNTKLLTPFIETLNGKDGDSSHIVVVTSGPFLSGALVSTPILLGEDGRGVLPGDEYDWGFDPNEDPELALALHLSVAEQRRLEEAQAGSSKREAVGGQQIEETSGNVHEAGGNRPSSMTEDEQIAYAIQMSMAEQSKRAVESSDRDMQDIVITEDDFLSLFRHLLSLYEEEEEEEEEDENEAGNSNNK